MQFDFPFAGCPTKHATAAVTRPTVGVANLLNLWGAVLASVRALGTSDAVGWRRRWFHHDAPAPWGLSSPPTRSPFPMTGLLPNAMKAPRTAKRYSRPERSRNNSRLVRLKKF